MRNTQGSPATFAAATRQALPARDRSAPPQKPTISFFETKSAPPRRVSSSANRGTPFTATSSPPMSPRPCPSRQVPSIESCKRGRRRRRTGRNIFTRPQLRIGMSTPLKTASRAWMSSPPPQPSRLSKPNTMRRAPRALRVLSCSASPHQKSLATARWLFSPIPAWFWREQSNSTRACQPFLQLARRTPPSVSFPSPAARLMGKAPPDGEA